MRKTTRQHVAGYLMGGSVFLLALPFGIYVLSRAVDGIFNIQLIPNAVARCAVSAVLLVGGLCFGLWSIVVQNRIGKGGPLEFMDVEISPKTHALVVTGPYRYTRNPMLFGTCTMYFAWALFLNSINALCLAALFTVFMLIFVKLTEEKRLLREFGAEYAEYRKKVSIFIPWPAKKQGRSLGG
jgi:protein-S-isoprenylcysteine O-methyltransferase Ste14